MGLTFHTYTSILVKQLDQSGNGKERERREDHRGICDRPAR